ncbi:hypothetical protein [Corynebacterium sp. A21]|uniref:hypothetical protein n=1 Tax=Corynebacterium sp. A21 TaxID=3457318 RepID=UPI003FCEFA12
MSSMTQPPQSAQEAQSPDNTLAYAKLQEWWMNEISDENRSRILDRVRPFGLDPEHGFLPIEGSHLSPGPSAARVLRSLDSWFTGPDHRDLGRKIAEKTLELAAYSPDPLDKHFALSSLITLYYRDRGREDFYSKALATCREQIAMQEQAKGAFLEEFPGTGLPGHVGYRQLAVVLEKEKKFQEALDLVREAQENGWTSDWDKRTARLEQKLAKQASSP